jgi:hypothetical protein
MTSVGCTAFDFYQQASFSQACIRLLTQNFIAGGRTNTVQGENNILSNGRIILRQNRATGSAFAMLLAVAA